MTYNIQSLHIYPIKACRGIQVDRARCSETGFEHDRQWMLVDEQGKFISLRDAPLLARVQPTLHERELALSYLHESIPILFFGLDEFSDQSVRVQVWDDEFLANRVSAQADNWFSGILGRSCSLVRMGPQSQRMADPVYAGEGKSVSFVDAFPYLVTSQASLDELNRRLQTQGEDALPMERFRPNIVLSGTPPFAEDEMKGFSTDSLHFKLVKPCDRCVVTTLDTHTLQYGKEPLRTLNQFRRVGNAVMFGMNALTEGRAELKVGDKVLPD